MAVIAKILTLHCASAVLPRARDAMNLNNRKKELMSRRSSHGGPTHKGCVGSIIQPRLLEHIHMNINIYQLQALRCIRAFIDGTNYKVSYL